MRHCGAARCRHGDVGPVASDKALALANGTDYCSLYEFHKADLKHNRDLSQESLPASSAY